MDVVFGELTNDIILTSPDANEVLVLEDYTVRWNGSFAGNVSGGTVKSREYSWRHWLQVLIMLNHLFGVSVTHWRREQDTRFVLRV